MDAKALAKSKRAHSLHHSKKHHQKPTTRIPTPVGPAAAKDAPRQTANQVTANVQQSIKRRNALPSNWDRYDDEDDLDLGNSAHGNLVKPTDVRKSKGSDYTYLISEAKSQLSSGNFFSFDDDITDFYQGLGPLLSVNEQSILYCIDDDNFDVDDKSTANVEVPFLTLDLNALSELLEEMDMCERMFIDTDDLLSEELSSSRVSKPNCSYKSEQILHEEVAEKENNASKSEAELDILLNSFSETKFLDSTTTRDHTKNYDKIENQENSTSYSKPTSITASLDDDLDDLLKETSHGMLGKSSDINLPQPQGGTWTSVQLDDTLDDLLNETSNLTNQSLSSPKPESYDSISKSMLLDDDSFFDQL